MTLPHLQSAYTVSTKTAITALVVLGLHAGSAFAESTNQNNKVNVSGVITDQGRPKNEFRVRIRGGGRAKTERGFYRITDAPRGRTTIYIGPRPPASRPRYYPKTTLSQPEEVRSYDMTPYYAADHGPFHYDLRLHRSWGNALDNPFDTAAGSALFENTHTLSGLVLKPVYAVALCGEVVWTVPGIVIAAGTSAVCKAIDKPFGMFGFSRTLLAGYLPIEAAVKVIEVPCKTLIWPVDRLWSWRARRRLEDVRTKILTEAATHNGGSGDKAST